MDVLPVFEKQSRFRPSSPSFEPPPTVKADRSRRARFNRHPLKRLSAGERLSLSVVFLRSRRMDSAPWVIAFVPYSIVGECIRDFYACQAARAFKKDSLASRRPRAGRPASLPKRAKRDRVRGGEDLMLWFFALLFSPSGRKTGGRGNDCMPFTRKTKIRRSDCSQPDDLPDAPAMRRPGERAAENRARSFGFAVHSASNIGYNLTPQDVKVFLNNTVFKRRIESARTPPLLP